MLLTSSRDWKRGRKEKRERRRIIRESYRKMKSAKKAKQKKGKDKRTEGRMNRCNRRTNKNPGANVTSQRDLEIRLGVTLRIGETGKKRKKEI
jgi:hypothetical protein